MKEQPEAPFSHQGSCVEVLHGKEVADPYRWLEDPDDAAVRAWVQDQREFCEAELTGIPERAWFTARMRQELLRPRAGTPERHGDRYFVMRNDGQQPQDCLFTAESLEELVAAGTLLVDPNQWSSEHTSSLGSFTPTADGSKVAIVRNDSGSDWQNIAVIDAATGERIDDTEVLAKFTQPTWLPGDHAYLYSTFPDAELSEGPLTAALTSQRIMVHQLDGAVGEDEEVLRFEDPRLMAQHRLSDDDAFVLLEIARGTERQNLVWLLPLMPASDVPTSDMNPGLGEPVTVINEADASWRYLGSRAGGSYFLTDHRAPLGRIVRIGNDSLLSGEHPGISGDTVVPGGDHPLADGWLTEKHLLLEELVDASAVLSRRDLDGRALGEVPLPSGSFTAINTTVDNDVAFVGVSQLMSPTTAFRVSADEGAVDPLALVAPQQRSEIVIERRRARSADGTQVPYWLVAAASTDLTRPQPTIAYGYGGFDQAVGLSYRAGWGAWLESGGLLVVANLRGGGEFGRDWYEAGRRAHKQHAFDDMIAVCEHLAATGASSSDQLAVYGRSNGGLLVGAVLTQRPELLSCALVQVGVLDMARFHKFTIGAAWISDYGDPDDPEEFATAMAYSPLHNIRVGVRYPACMVLTGDHDDRVVPAHSHKFTAALQSAQGDQAPVISRIETATGHGAGKPSAKEANEWADLLAFAARHTGLRHRTGLC